MEVADIIVVQKADLPRAEQVAAQVRSVLDLGASKVIPVVLVSAKTGRGVSEFWQHISAAAPHRRDEIDRGARLLQAAAAQMSDEVHRLRNQNDSSLIDLIRRWQRREMGDREAAIELLQLVLGKLGQHVTQAS